MNSIESQRPNGHAITVNGDLSIIRHTARYYHAETSAGKMIINLVVPDGKEITLPVIIGKVYNSWLEG